jgi:glycosyltransferase involved in cell wall biosynthesis
MSTFAVVIPADDAALFLPRALASVAAQTCAPAEVIVVDDGSRDETAELAQAWGARVIRQANRGPSAARNTGVAAAGAPWIAFLDADDSWAPHALERFEDAVRRAPDVAIVFADYAVDEPGACVSSWFASDREFHRISRRRLAPGVVRCDRPSLVEAITRSLSFVSTSAMVIRRDAFLTCGGFDESLRVAEDLDLLLRLFAQSTAAVIEEVVSTYHKHGANLTADPIVNAEWELRVWRRIAANPERYAPEALAALTLARPRRLTRAGLYALRGARFREAHSRFAQSCSLRFSFASALGIVLAIGLDNRVGRAAHAALRGAWRRSRGTAAQ